MKIVFRTQVEENYAWDSEGNLGTGENAYWKMKGGHEYLVEDVSIAFLCGSDVRKFAQSLVSKFEFDSVAYREYVIDWSVECDDYVPDFERAQLEYDGVITFREKRIPFSEVSSQELA